MARSLARMALGPAALACGLASAGCGEELGPESIPRTSATGVVLVSGRPVDRGWVEFQPVDGTLGDLASARIRPDGTFRLDRVPVGEVCVRLIDVPLGSTGASWVFRNNSPIRRRTQSPPGPPLTIEVVEELMRYQKLKEGPR